MDDRSPLSGHARIDAAEICRVEILDEGRTFRLHLTDRSGRPASVTLPTHCLNRVLSAIPRSAGDLLSDGPRTVHTVDSWSISRGEQKLLLTLHLPDGARMTFAVEAWQIAAMASLTEPDNSFGGRRLN